MDDSIKSGEGQHNSGFCEYYIPKYVLTTFEIECK